MAIAAIPMAMNQTKASRILALANILYTCRCLRFCIRRFPRTGDVGHDQKNAADHDDIEQPSNNSSKSLHMFSYQSSIERDSQVPTKAPHAAAVRSHMFEMNATNRIADITGMMADHKDAIIRFLDAIAFVYSAQIISSRT